MKLNKSEQKLLTKKREYSPIASELARKARWAGARVFRDKTKYTRKTKYKEEF